MDTSTPLPQCQEILAFLKGHFLHDILAPELSVSHTVCPSRLSWGGGLLLWLGSGPDGLAI